MRRFIPLCAIVIFLISSCGRQKYEARSEDDIISFLSGYSIEVDTRRPAYTSTVLVPEIFDTIWEMRDTLSKDVLGISLKQYRGKECSIYMYPLLKTPFEGKNGSDSEARAVIICRSGYLICSYIEFISPLRGTAPMSLGGESIEKLSGIKWTEWRERIEDDDNKRLVIWQYYDALRMGNYEGAYWYLYDKDNIKKEDFMAAAKQGVLPYIDFLGMEQYKKPLKGESYFKVKAEVDGGQGSPDKVYEIIFDLKKDPKEEKYGGWKILSTKIK